MGAFAGHCQPHCTGEGGSRAFVFDLQQGLAKQVELLALLFTTPGDCTLFGGEGFTADGNLGEDRLQCGNGNTALQQGGDSGLITGGDALQPQ